jgi:hypothetical protein
MRISLYVACLLLVAAHCLPLSAASFAFPDDDNVLSGVWKGKITQNGQADIVASEYYFELSLTVRDGLVYGSSYSYVRNMQGKYVLRLSLEGKQADGRVLLSESKVIEYHNTISQKASFCIKQMELKLKKQGDEWVLEGSWSGLENTTREACVPGSIRLSRKSSEHSGEAMSFTFDKVTQLRDRKVKKGHTVKVYTKDITLRVFDEGKVDGDIISLNLNGNWILENYTLKENARSIKIKLEPDALSNYLIVYAHNMGKMPPNTTAIIFNDGRRERKVILNADMDTCDVIYFELVNP